MKIKGIESLLSPEAKKQLGKGLSDIEERKFRNLIKLMEKEGIPRCPSCLEPMKELDNYSYKPNCNCSKKDYRIMMG